MNRFTAFGQYFGYPKCCIEWFMDSRVHKTIPYALTETQQVVEEGEGFIPCPSCARKVLRERLQLSDLILDSRICPTPYPQRDLGQALQWIDEQERQPEYEHIRIH